MEAVDHPLLLAVIELGGYPNFVPLYQRLGLQVQVETSMRKALAWLKRERPGVVVAEFNFQSDFRDRTSSLESLLAVLQRQPQARCVVFYEPQYRHQLDRLLAHHPVFATLAFPVDEAELARVVTAAMADAETLTPV